MEPPPNEDKYIVPGLVRGLAVLRVFSPERPRLSLSEIARELGISRSAAFRAVYTLAETGYLLQDDSGGYTLGPGVLRLTHGYVTSREIVETAQPELEALHAALGWSAHLGVRDGASVLYLLRISSQDRRVSIVQVGSRLPARSTVLGRVLLADLPAEEIVQLYRGEKLPPLRGNRPALPAIVEQARHDAAEGMVIHMGDFEARILSIAAPLRDATGRVVAAISLTAPASPRAETQLHGTVREALDACARRISALMGHGADMAPE